MKKIISYIIGLFLLISLGGCGDSASMAVKDYLDKYNSLDNEVIVDIDDIVERENLDNDEDKQTYINIFKKQYTDLSYEILSEEYDGDEATIKVKVTVYDLYKAQNDANSYLANHSDEFNDEDGNYNPLLFIKYKLKQMQDMTDKVDYTIDFYVVKTEDGWVVSSLSNSDLEKIHGIYDYNES